MIFIVFYVIIKQKWFGGLPVIISVERTAEISAKLDSERGAYTLYK